MGDVLQPGLRGVTTLYQGSVYETFERPLPEVVESTIFKEFEGMFNQTQVRVGAGRRFPRQLAAEATGIDH